MAITRSQIAKQLLANGGRTGLRGGGAGFSDVKSTAGTDNTNRGYSSNVSPSSSTAGVTESNRRSGGQDASNFNRDRGYNPNVSPSSTTANKLFEELQVVIHLLVNLLVKKKINLTEHFLYQSLLIIHLIFRLL